LWVIGAVLECCLLEKKPLTVIRKEDGFMVPLFPSKAELRPATLPLLQGFICYVLEKWSFYRFLGVINQKLLSEEESKRQEEAWKILFPTVVEHFSQDAKSVLELFELTMGAPFFQEEFNKFLKSVVVEKSSEEFTKKVLLETIFTSSESWSEEISLERRREIFFGASRAFIFSLPLGKPIALARRLSEIHKNLGGDFEQEVLFVLHIISRMVSDGSCSGAEHLTVIYDHLDLLLETHVNKEEIKAPPSTDPIVLDEAGEVLHSLVNSVCDRSLDENLRSDLDVLQLVSIVSGIVILIAPFFDKKTVEKDFLSCVRGLLSRLPETSAGLPQEDLKILLNNMLQLSCVPAYWERSKRLPSQKGKFVPQKQHVDLILSALEWIFERRDIPEELFRRVVFFIQQCTGDGLLDIRNKRFQAIIDKNQSIAIPFLHT
jgi:hypothetical protein